MRNSQPNLILSDPNLISDAGDAGGWSADSDLISPGGWPSGPSLIGQALISGNQSSLTVHLPSLFEFFKSAFGSLLHHFWRVSRVGFLPIPRLPIQYYVPDCSTVQVVAAQSQ